MQTRIVIDLRTILPKKSKKTLGIQENQQKVGRLCRFYLTRTKQFPQFRYSTFMDKSKYYLDFNEFISKLDSLDKVEIPKGYIAIDAKKDTKKSTKHKNSRKR